MLQNGVGLLETPYNFFIDHLAPLCHYLNWPILSSNPQTKLLYHKYYPNVEIRLKNWSLNFLVEHYTSILYSFDPQPSFRSLLQEMRRKEPKNPLWRKKLHLLYHFHGCSDKGYHSTWIDPKGHFKDLDLVFIYGQRMREILQDKGLYSLPQKILSIGNYRKNYYEKHLHFFDQKVHLDLFSKFKRKAPLLLYAPTWQDCENSGSFSYLQPSIFEKLSKSFNILIKLHPNSTLKRPGYDPTETLKKIKALSKLPHVLTLPFYPLIYPLLKKADLYLGDFSSVGYDALAYPKPLIFLNALNRPLEDPGAKLFKAGLVIAKKDFNQIPTLVKKEFEKRDFFSLSAQKALYDYAFSPNSIEELLKDFQEKENLLFS